MHYITSHHIIYASATHTRARAQAQSRAATKKTFYAITFCSEIERPNIERNWQKTLCLKS